MLANFWTDRRGAIAPIFAGVLIPGLALVGMSVDYARALSAKSQLQAAADAAAAAGARLPATANQNRAEAALKVFASNAARKRIANATPAISANNSEVTVSANVDVKSAFLGLIGVKKLYQSQKSLTHMSPIPHTD